MSESVVYELKHPIEVKAKDGDEVVEKITSLTLKRPKGKHLKAMDKAQGENAKVLALIAACSGQPPSVTDELDAEDFAGLAEIVESFFGGRLPTGATFSET